MGREALSSLFINLLPNWAGGLIINILPNGTGCLIKPIINPLAQWGGSSVTVHLSIELFFYSTRFSPIFIRLQSCPTAHI